MSAEDRPRSCRPRHWFTVYGLVGVRSPYCSRCGTRNPNWPGTRCAYRGELGEPCGEIAALHGEGMALHEFMPPQQRSPTRSICGLDVPPKPPGREFA